MIKHLIVTSLAVLSVSPAMAFTTTMGMTNDGAILSFDPDIYPTLDSRSGMTVFGYTLEYPNDVVIKRRAATPYCYRGKVQQNPRARVKMPNPGWYAVLPNKTIQAVNADSEASQGLLEVVCAVQDGQLRYGSDQ